MVADGRLEEADFRRMARLHVESIDDSLPALLGAGFTRAMYRFLAGSEHETLLFERVDGQVESVCVLSAEPDTLQARLARATLPQMLWAFLRALLVRADLRRWLRGRLTDSLGGAAHGPPGPEITYVFTNPELRGRRLGTRLLERTDLLLAGEDVPSYFVKTLDDPGNRAIAFYERNGFAKIGNTSEGGRSFVAFRKDLATY